MALKFVIPGGNGNLGRLLRRSLAARGHSVTVISRGASDANDRWDGRNLGPWMAHLDGADVVINLAGRSVDCRYTKTNLSDMLSSRVDSTHVIGEAIASVAKPPPLWLQMSTATIYAHREDAPNDEATGILGGSEPDVPAYWRFSVEIARAWERAQTDAPTPATRKVALRTAMVMNNEAGGVFEVLRRLTRCGLGGKIAGGRQYMSWIHGSDFVDAIEFLTRETSISGAVNLAAPHPLPQAEFMATLRRACGVPLGLPASRWMVEMAAFILGTDSELLLKSRRVTPGLLLAAGFEFKYPAWKDAAADLLS